MPTDSKNPTWIEPPPPPARKGMGCTGKGCIFLVAFAVLTVVLIGLGSYLLYSGGSKPTVLPVEELTPEHLAQVKERVDQFENTPPSPDTAYTPAPISPPSAAAATPAPVEEATPIPDVTPDAIPSPTPRELVMTASEINGLIAANKRSRGHAFVSLSGDTASVEMSIAADKVPGFPKGYLNGSFQITTNGPTSIRALQVSKIQANGFPVPSSVLSMSYRGQTLLGYALDAASPYNVSTAEIRDGKVFLH
ncbi:MAG: hypothetical protein ACR2G0_09350 [Chthoniobacterales bacterium]